MIALFVYLGDNNATIVMEGKAILIRLVSSIRILLTPRISRYESLKRLYLGGCLFQQTHFPQLSCETRPVSPNIGLGAEQQKEDVLVQDAGR